MVWILGTAILIVILIATPRIPAKAGDASGTTGQVQSGSGNFQAGRDITIINPESKVDQTERAQQRAWLSVEMKADFNNVVDRVNHGKLFVNVKNNGAFAARNVKLSYCVGNSATKGIPECELQIEGLGDLAPNASRLWYHQITYPFPDAPAYQSYHPLFIKGRLDYSHGFGKGVTTFCAFLDTEVPYSLLRLCSGHNEVL